jgi:hypothetical protein
LPLHASSTDAVTPHTPTMSLVPETRRHLLRWATRAATRPMAIIPESHQVKEKKDAQRVDFFGDQQDIDSRYDDATRVDQPTSCAAWIASETSNDAELGLEKGVSTPRSATHLSPPGWKTEPDFVVARDPERTLTCFPAFSFFPLVSNRYAMLDKVRLKAVAFEERYRKDGKGFVRPWETNPELKKVVDPVSHLGDDETK